LVRISNPRALPCGDVISHSVMPWIRRDMPPLTTAVGS
jgi:hypothetical protein